MVQRVITDLGVFDVGIAGFTVVELAPDVTFAEAAERTGAPLTDGRAAA